MFDRDVTVKPPALARNIRRQDEIERWQSLVQNAAQGQQLVLSSLGLWWKVKDESESEE